MRQVVALLLLCSLSVHGAGRLGIVATWWLQRDYVARVLCMNCDKPQMRCNGRCHLAKRLKAVEAAEHKQQPVNGKQVFQDITLFCTALGTMRLAPPASGFPRIPHYPGLQITA